MKLPGATHPVILCTSRRQAEQAMARLRSILGKLLLELNEEKTHIVDLRWGREGFDFLGFHLHMRRMITRPELTALNRWPSPKACKAFRRRIKEITDRSNEGKPIADIVRELNQVIRGWRGYFGCGQSARVFHHLDHYIRLRVAYFTGHKHKGTNRKWGRARPLGFYYGLGLCTLGGNSTQGGRMPVATSR